MNDFTAPNQPKIDDRKWGSIHRDTTPFSIVDFRPFRAGQIVQFIVSQFLGFLLAVLCCGCGYRWHSDFAIEGRPTVIVPFIKGDEDGTLTSEIVRTLTTLGIADVHSHHGDFRLHIAILETKNQPIGYRRDRQKISGEIQKNIVACEGRKTLTVQATLYEGASDQIRNGPFIISEDTDYDYVDGDSIQDLAFVNSEGVFTTVLPFSLGQLESVESAQEAANRPLHEKLAQKIVDALF